MGSFPEHRLVIEPIFLSNSVFKCQTSTGSGLVESLGSGLVHSNLNQFVGVKAYKKGEGLTSGWRASLKKVFA